MLLSNAGYRNNVNDIGYHLIDPELPVKPQRRSVAVEPGRLEHLVGVYQFAAFKITVTRQDARLFAQLTNQDMFEVFALSETEFFYRIVDAQLSFELGGSAGATAVVLHQGGTDRRGARM